VLNLTNFGEQNEKEHLQTKINILQDILDKKRALMEQILNICENTEQIFNAPQERNQHKEILQEMGLEKQALIDKILEYDEIFQKIFDDIRPDFELNFEKYPKQIERLQLAIKEVFELDSKIRIRENKAREKLLANAVLSPKKHIKTKTTTTNRNYILNQYKNNSKKS